MRDEARARALRERARGTVLELGAGQHTDACAEERAPSDEQYDTIVSIDHLGRARDPRREVGAIVRLLAPEGQLLLLERTSTPGLVGALQRVASGANHDVPAILRAAGLSMSECERIHTATGVWVEAVAFHTILPERERVAP